MRSKSRMRYRGLALGAIVVSIALLGTACGSSKSKGSGSSDTTASTTAPITKTVVVGQKDFPSAQVISQLYGQALAAKGFKVSFKDVGPTEQTYATSNSSSIVRAR